MSGEYRKMGCESDRQTEYRFKYQTLDTSHQIIELWIGHYLLFTFSVRERAHASLRQHKTKQIKLFNDRRH